MREFFNRFVNRWRKVEGVEALVVKQHKLSSAGKSVVREVGNTRNINRIGAVGAR